MLQLTGLSANITAIAAGSEVLTSIPNAAPILVPAMNYLHKALLPSKLNLQIVDRNTHFHYNSMFDAMVDATYKSIAALSFSGIPIVVTESGWEWPWLGGTNEPDATEEDAEGFLNNLILHVLHDLDRITGDFSAVMGIAKQGLDPKLQIGLNWACGQGQAQPCYFPDTLKNHASYA
ncbi:hypothetical protein F0562_025875 [Nyssa sinensis]|uniref:Glucan endo-1,3-beta-D-glucosidase n=1 Tax=Nyssa sinensis TaxID=561372 RepID=A0A5J5B7I2_9ASTE|nr:hypothetical protein F0562_025875 [Nyssa sinensis]